MITSLFSSLLFSLLVFFFIYFFLLHFFLNFIFIFSGFSWVRKEANPSCFYIFRNYFGFLEKKMYGDCQVLSSMAGNGVVVSPDSFFPPLQIGQNPNFGFMSGPFSVFHPIIPKEEGGLGMKGKEEVESGSVSEQIEGMSGNEQDGDERLPPPPEEEQPPSKKQRYHRHTAHQIQEMEALFKENPHPDDKARQKLSQELGLKPRQVKFWFQNRRTQMKAQQDRSDNAVLRVENESLKNDNYRLQAALRNIVCTNCGGPAWLAEVNYDEQQLRIENARLKEEYDRMCCLLTQYTGRQVQPIMSPSPHLFPSTLELDPSGPFPRKYEEMGPGSFAVENLQFPPGCPLILDDEKSLAMELAVSCVDELVKMCHAGKPLWVRGDNGREMLNGDEYGRLFPWPLGSSRSSRPSGVGFEATRASAVVIMNSITLVDAFLDAGKWMELFPSIVARAKNIQVVVPGVSGHASGSLHLMYGEFQALTPLLPARESYFLRYCEHNAEEGTWAVVDFPHDGLHVNFPPSFPYYKRKPSGCIIQDMPNGYSRVTWIEHAEIEGDSTLVTNQIFRDLVTSGEAFGARRWLAVLQRQCERVASLMARNLSDLGVIPSPEARKNMMNLAQRMIKTFCVNISTSFGQSWTSISAESAEDTVRITTRKVTEPGQPVGLVLSAVSTTWLPHHHSHVFDLLRDERHRAQLDALSNGNSLHEVAHIANGSHPGNSISLLRINVASNSSQSVELMLQECCTDDSGSLVVYATMDVEAVQLAMSGGDPSVVPLLPLGFVITPVRPHAGSDEGGDGCLLTVALQVLASSVPTAKLSLSSVTAINHHLCSTVQQINAALGGSSEQLAAAPPPHVKLSKDAPTPCS